MLLAGRYTGLGRPSYKRVIIGSEKLELIAIGLANAISFLDEFRRNSFAYQVVSTGQSSAVILKSVTRA
jgi:hypothetical protein